MLCSKIVIFKRNAVKLGYESNEWHYQITAYNNLKQSYWSSDIDATKSHFPTLRIPCLQKLSVSLPRYSCFKITSIRWAQSLDLNVYCTVFTHADGSRVSIAIIRVCDSVCEWFCLCLSVCLSVCLHDETKTAETKIANLTIPRVLAH